MRRQLVLGVTKNTVKIGTELTIEAYRAKEGTYKAVGRNFTLPDGSRLFLVEVCRRSELQARSMTARFIR